MHQVIETKRDNMKQRKKTVVELAFEYKSNMSKKIEDKNLDLIKRKRFEAYLANDKDPYICYRFTIALEELLPQRFSQIKPVSAIPDGELTADEMIIETDPIKVAERYIQRPLYNDKEYLIRPDTKWYMRIKELAHQYMDYLYSNALERLRDYGENKEKWERFI